MQHENFYSQAPASLAFAEIVGALSHALDLTEGQPAGHCLRSAQLALAIGRAIGLDHGELRDLAYATMLKDLGCSSNAARIHELYKSDDLAFKRAYKVIAPGLPSTLRFVFRETGRGAALSARVRAVRNILRNGDAIAQEMIATRCTRGSDIAGHLGFGPAVCEAIYHLDEHWDGSGRPAHRAGTAIPLYSRIALLCQIADVFYQAADSEVAVAEVGARAGTWLDPELVRAFRRVARQPSTWRALGDPAGEQALYDFLSQDQGRVADDAMLDLLTDAFGQVIDAKSPYTAGHSGRVADFSERLAEALDVLPTRRRWLRRAAALHDIGKLGVSNAILDKPGKLDDDEWRSMRGHADHTRAILARVPALGRLADIAAAHHERLDGKGYPLGLDDRSIARETRVISLCDFYDALTADRPYRAAMPLDQALSIIEGEVGKAVDGECFAMLKTLVACDPVIQRGSSLTPINASSTARAA